MNSKTQSSKILILLLAVCFLIQAPIQAQANPKNTIEKAGSQIISILKNKSLKKSVKKERISKIFIKHSADKEWLKQPYVRITKS